MTDNADGMITVARHYARIGDRTRYAESEGRDKETGKLIWERPDGTTRTEVLDGFNFDYPVTDDRRNLRRAVRDMNRTIKQPPDEVGANNRKGQTRRPAHELILSWKEGDHPTNEHMVETSRSALDKIGMRDALSIVFRHRDTDNDHVHIVSSRINPRTGYVYRDSHENLKLRAWARDYQRQRDRSRGPDLERERAVARKRTIDHGAQRAWDRMPAPELTPTQEWQPWPAHGTGYDEQLRQKSLAREIQDPRERWAHDALEQAYEAKRSQTPRAPDKELHRDPQVGWRQSSMEELKQEWQRQAAEQPSTDPEWRRITEGRMQARDFQHPDNFDEFAASRGLGRSSAKEAEKLKNDHANERMLSDFNYFNNLDKPEREAEEARDAQRRDQHNGGGLRLIRNPTYGWVNRALNDYEPSVDELAIRGRALTTERQIAEHLPRERVQQEAEHAQERERPTETKEPSDDAAVAYASAVDHIDRNKVRKAERSAQMVHEVVEHEAEHEMEMEMDDGFGGD